MLRALARRRRANSRAFTLIELIVVIAIILILVTVLIIVITQFLGRGEEEEAKERIRMIEDAIAKWQDETGKNQNVFPGVSIKSYSDKVGSSGFNAGAIELFDALIIEPEKKGGTRFLSVSEDADPPWISEISTNKGNRKVLLDPWGTPFAYFEWASKGRAVADDTDPMAKASAARGAPDWARNKGEYDIFSAGPDKQWGTEDDFCRGGFYNDVYDVDKQPNPFAK